MIGSMVEAVNDPRLRICLDVGHAHCNSHTSVLAWIQALRTKIGFVHLHNNHGERDEHLPFAQGSMDMLAVCHALDEHAPDAIWAIELPASELAGAVLWLQKNGFIS